MTEKFKIYYPQVGDNPGHRHHYFQRILDEFAVQGIEHDGNQTFIELNSQFSWNGLKNFTVSHQKMAVVHLAVGVDYTLERVKTEVHSGKYSCYALSQALLYRATFDYLELNIFERVKSLNLQYGEARLKQV